MVAAFRTVYCACVLSRFSHVWLFGTPWTLSCQAPLSMGFARQEYCSGLLSTPLGDLPDPGIKSTSPAAPALQGTFFVSVPPGKPLFTKYQVSGNPLQCSCLENPRDGGAWWAAVYGVAQSRTRLKWLSSSKYPMGERNGNPLQYPCLENPVDRGAWWAAVRGVAQSQTRLKWLSMHACIREGNGNPLDLAAAAAGIQFCNFAGNTELDSYTKRIKLVITILQIEHWGIAVKGKTSKQKRFKAKHSDSRLYVFCYNVKQPLNTTGSFSTGKTKCSLQRLWFFKAVIWEVCNPCLVMLLQLEYFWNGSFGITFIACSSFFE